MATTNDDELALATPPACRRIVTVKEMREHIHRLMPELMQLVDEIAAIADSGCLPDGPWDINSVSIDVKKWASGWRKKILTPGRNNG